MAVLHFGRFLAEATIPDPDPTHHLGEEQLFGLYVSWCLLDGRTPASESDFREAMKQHRIHRAAPGLWRTGPAARDYILHTYPSLP